jgi:hypothetical protein
LSLVAGDMDRDDHAIAVIRVPMWKDATRTHAVFVCHMGELHFTANVDSTYNSNNIYGVVTSDGNEFLGVVVATWGKRINFSWMLEIEVHLWTGFVPRSRQSHMPSTVTSRKAPNPWIFLVLSLSSFAAFALVVKHRENTNPASKQPRQADHPLIPPRHKEGL